MANLLITTEGLGVKFDSGNSRFTINEFSIKRSNILDGTIHIVSDIKENYAEYPIIFSNYGQVTYNGVVVADIDELETILENISQNTVGIISDGTIVSTNEPLPVKRDRIYPSDIDLTRSENNNFGNSVDDILMLFKDLHTAVSDTTSNATKILLIHFNWSASTSGIALECNEAGDFSNVKVEVLRGGGSSILIADESADNTKHKTRFFSFAGSPLPIPPILGINALRLTFSTTDTVTLTDIPISTVGNNNAFLITKDEEAGVLEYIKSTDGFLNVFALAKEYESYVNKWGQNDDIDTGTVPETIWDGSNLYTYSDQAIGAIYSASSDNIADIGMTFIAELITLIPVSGDFQREYVTITLNGQTPVDFAPPSGNQVVGCNRAWNPNGTLYIGNIYIYENTATVVGGIPTLATLIRAIVTPSAQQTRQAVYIVPDITENGVRIIEAHILSWDLSIIKTTTVVMDAYFMVAEPNGVFRARDVTTVRNERSGGYVWGDNTPLKVPTKSRVEIRAVSISANNGSAVGKFKAQLVTENEPN